MDFSALSSPVLFQGDYKFAYRDPAVTYHEGQFHLFFTLVERSEDGGCYWFTAKSKSRDLIHWTFPRTLTPRDRTLNHSSPGNIVRYRGKWLLCLQTYPTPNKEKFGDQTARIFVMRSQDLEQWEDPELLRVKGDATPRESMGRMIDPFLIEDVEQPGTWFCFYKQDGVSMSYSHDLDRWTYVGSKRAGENVTVIRQGSEYVMFHSPRNGIGVKRSRSLDQWGEDQQLLTLGQDRWPWAKDRLTAATVIDLTQATDVGKYVMFFHGSARHGDQPAHGEASLGVAWSDDLRQWSWPGSTTGP